jgi:hypothetical protein
VVVAWQGMVWRGDMSVYYWCSGAWIVMDEYIHITLALVGSTDVLHLRLLWFQTLHMLSAPARIYAIDVGHGVSIRVLGIMVYGKYQTPDRSLQHRGSVLNLALVASSIL